MSEQSSKPPEFPGNWVRTKLGNVISLEYGKGLSKKDRDTEGKCPVYGSNGVVGYHSEPLVEGPVLIVGRKGAVGEIHLSDGPCWPIDTTYFVRKSEHLDLHFTYYLLKASRLRSLDKSTAIPGLNREDAYDQDVPIPPLKEQRRIVNKIEALFTRLDAGVQELQQAKERLEQYRRAVLKAAVEGKLTEESRKNDSVRVDSPARGELETPSESIEDTIGLPELPPGWIWVYLGDVADIQSGVTKNQNTKHKNTKTVPYLRVANVQRGYIELSEIKEIEVPEEKVAQLALRNGDVLFTEGGDRDKLGRGWIWEEQLPVCIHQNHIFRARLMYNGMSSKFVSWFANIMGKTYFMSHGKQTTNLASINMTNLKNFPVPVPPPSEAFLIVEEVERRLSVISEMYESIDNELSRASFLRQAILKHAFSGNLVPQDPNDEPAEKLLERIKQEKQDGKKPSKNSKGTKPGEQQRLIDHAD